ncbi:hypothetical protein EZV62_016993 [Acer yangbiense]|uniref:COBRA-like protein n=1 Tax=Acer yangbiense TaxID=1000413 RepID=A0A5C7HQN6_9ROSI|nr:hypothetical protein EZV62_016993 [Acer yangbiense]
MAPPTFYQQNHLLLLLLLCTLISLLSFTTTAASDWHGTQKRHEATENWLNHGGDLYNRRYASKETKISLKTVSKLSLKWEFYAGKDISATPSIFNGTLYFPSWNGQIYAVKASDGSLVWKKNLQNLTGFSPTPGLVANVNWTVSRSTPTVVVDDHHDHDLLIIGVYGPAFVVAVKRSTGELVWSTQLDHNPASVITMSGTYYKGLTSKLAKSCGKPSCFRITMGNGKTGAYAGAAIWGSSPSIDIHRNHVYIATGNLYSVPPHIEECQKRENNQTVPTHPDECVEPDNHSDSILAMDLDSGKIKWYHQLGGYDVWFGSCNNFSTPGCPPGPNPDADFGEAPMMLSMQVNGIKKDIVVAVQKSGFAWALDRDNGTLMWATEAGPSGLGGGGIWGAATDEKRIYTNIANIERKNFTLKPSNKTTNSGGWVVVDARNGKILWSIADPSNAAAFGPVSVANSVVFVGSTHLKGPIYAMNAKTGKIVWSYETGATVYGGMSISNGCIYVGNGYNVSIGAGLATDGTSLFAFYGYDPLDPHSNITITWDLLQSNGDTNDVTVSIFNFQSYRHVDEPGWRVSWAWSADEVIWSMVGAEATEQGNCSAFKARVPLPHCCEKRPVIVDLLPGAPYNQQTKNCCKGGVLTSMSQDPSKSASTFQMNVGGVVNNTGFAMPVNFSLGVPGYTCGDPFEVPPSRFSTDKGRRWTQALRTWNVTCMYSQFIASQNPKCCVSLSAFYNDTIIPCPRCSCQCQDDRTANCIKYGETPSLLQQKHDPNEEPPQAVICSEHMCPIRVHWHVKQSYKEYWRVKMTVTNMNVMRNYSQWNMVVLHPNLQSVTQVFSFNYKPLNQYDGYINDTGMLWGIQYYNDMLLQAGESGNVQTEILFHKDEGMFTFGQGWAFPRRIMFNGDECVMPPPDQYPTLPNNASHSASTPTFITILFSFLLFLKLVL